MRLQTCKGYFKHLGVRRPSQRRFSTKRRRKQNTTAKERNTRRSARDANDILAGKEEALRAAFPKREGGFNVVRQIITKEGIQKDE